MITAHNNTDVEKAEGPGSGQVEVNSVYDIGPVSPDVEIRETRLAAAAGQVLVKIPRQGEGREGLRWLGRSESV